MSRKRSLLTSVVALMLSVFCGCDTALSTPEQKMSQQQPAQSAEAASAAMGSDNPGIRLQCMVERIRRAPAPFHWSFVRVVPPLTKTDWEADISADSITATTTDTSGSRSVYAKRSNPTEWNTAVTLLTASLPASTFALVNNSSAVARARTEEANGKDAIKYEIDTSRDTPADASLIRNVLGAGGFVRGAAWVTRNGCPIKFALDMEQYNKNGVTQREHYEENVTTR